jgi:hypothetical protein
MANTRKRKQKQTLKEFRAWLQGVEELQSEDWSPNCDQWKLIRDKIDGIIEEKQIIEKVVQAAPAGAPGFRPPMPPPAAPSLIPPPLPGGVPHGDVQMAPAAQQMLSPSGGAKAKTPDIDTSDGNVSSSFA